MKRLLSTFALGLTLCLLTAACTSAPSSKEGKAMAGPEGTPLRIAYISYRNGQRIELVNEAHTDRVEQYSEVRTNADRKVQTNDVMAGLVEVLYEYGYGKYEVPGAAPTEGAGRWAWAIEMEGAGGINHVLAGPGLGQEEQEDLIRYAAAIVDTYNATYGLQAVEVTPGQSPFQSTPSRQD
jgi:hypothetical protein